MHRDQLPTSPLQQLPRLSGFRGTNPTHEMMCLRCLYTWRLLLRTGSGVSRYPGFALKVYGLLLFYARLYFLILVFNFVWFHLVFGNAKEEKGRRAAVSPTTPCKAASATVPVLSSHCRRLRQYSQQRCVFFLTTDHICDGKRRRFAWLKISSHIAE